MSLRFDLSPASGGDPAPAERAERAGRAGRALGADAAEALLAHGAALGNLDLLRRGALAVTTGQQAGLFTGPLFSVYKALTAAALAGQLSGRLGKPVVPMFWVAGDDHDWAEINNCVVLGTDGKPERIVLRERAADQPMLPAYREPVGRDGAAALAQLEALLPPSDFRTATLDWLGRAYDPSHSMAEAYAVAMAELLAPYGVVVVRGWHAGLKRAGRTVLFDALRRAGEIEQALAGRAAQLAAAGEDVPVDVGQGLTLLMLEGHAGRDRLRVAAEGGFAARRGHETLSLADLERIADEEPERLSPNVLLRPVVEAAVFPTVAYVGGPGELKYLAQTHPVFDLLGVTRQAFVPRAGGSMIEAKVDKVLDRYGLTPADLLKPSAELAARVAQDDLPPAVSAALKNLRDFASANYDGLRDLVAVIDQTMQKPVESARNNVLGGLNEIEKKLTAALARRNDTALQQLARARDALAPLGQPQERVLTAASFLSRHGREAIDLAWVAARSHAASLLEGTPRGS